MSIISRELNYLNKTIINKGKQFSKKKNSSNLRDTSNNENKMFFYWDYVINGFLFENFNIDTLTKCLLIIFLVFVMAFMNEAIRIVQKVVNKKFTNWSQISNPCHSAATNSDVDETSPLVQSLRIPISNDEIKRRRSAHKRLI